jgi:hypothetical protein
LIAAGYDMATARSLYRKQIGSERKTYIQRRNAQILTTLPVGQRVKLMRSQRTPEPSRYDVGIVTAQHPTRVRVKWDGNHIHNWVSIHDVNPTHA